MKKSIFYLAAAAMMAFSCQQYDDTPLVDRVTNLENRVAALEKLQTQMDELQTLVKAIENKDYVTGVTPIMEGGVQVGYAIMFTQSGTVEIRNGRDGVDGNDGNDGAAGKDGSVVSIKQDTDGVWYWTIDGAFTEPKLRVDGATPQFKIDEEAYLCVSYDGQTWERLGKTGATVSSNYKIEYDEDNVYITFVDEDNNKITLPREKEFTLSIARSAGIGVKEGASVNIPYVLTNADNTVVVETISENGFKAEVVKTSNSEGNIKVTAPTPFVAGKVLVFANKGDKTCMKALYFEAEEFTMATTAYAVDKFGGNVEMKFTTNLDYKVEIPADASWITLVETKAAEHTVVLKIEANTGAARSAVVVVKNAEGVELQKVTISQDAYREDNIEVLFGFQPYTDDTHGMTKDAHYTMAAIGNYLILSNAKNVAEMPVYDRMTGEFLSDVHVNVTGIDTNREIRAIANDNAGHMIAVAYSSLVDEDTTNDTVRGWVWLNGIDQAPKSFMWASLGGGTYANNPNGVNDVTKFDLYNTVKVYGDLSKDAVIATASRQNYRPVFEFVKDGKLQSKAVANWPGGSALVSMGANTTVVPLNFPADVTKPTADLEYGFCSGMYSQGLNYANLSTGTSFRFTNPTTHWWAQSGYANPVWGFDMLKINGTIILAAQNGLYANAKSEAGINRYTTRLVVSNVGATPSASSLASGFIFDSREGDLVKGTEANGGPKGTGYGVNGMSSAVSYVSGKTVLADNDKEVGACLLVPGADGKSVQAYMLTQNNSLIAYTIPFSKF